MFEFYGKWMSWKLQLTSTEHVKGSILIASIQVEPIEGYEPLFDAALVWFTSSSINY